MKRIFRLKLVLTLAALIMIAAAIAVPLSSSIMHTHAQASPTITVNPTSGPSGTVITVTGSGWTPGKLIDIRFGTSGPSAATLTVASDGTFSTILTVPANEPLGSLTISADLAGVTALTTFTITPPVPTPVPTPKPPIHIKLHNPLSHIQDQVRDILRRELERLDVGVGCALTIVKQTVVVKLASTDLTLIELDFKLATQPDREKQLLDVENAFLDIAGFKPLGCLTGFIKVVTGKDTDVCPINILDCIKDTKRDIIHS